jgi:PAS domain S-box-containing protein
MDKSIRTIHGQPRERMQEPSRLPGAPAICYGVAVLLTALCAFLQAALQPLVDGRYPYLFFCLAVGLSAWIGGLWPGVFATLLVVATVTHAFVPTKLGVFPTASGDIVVACTFLAFGIIASLLFERAHRIHAHQREEARFAHVIGALAGDFDFQLDPSRPIREALGYVGVGFKRLTGFDIVVTSGFGGWLRVVHPEDRKLARDISIGVALSQTLSGRLRLLTAARTTVWVEYRTAPYTSSDGTRTVVAGAIRDISAQIAAEQQTNAADARFRAIAEYVKEPVFMRAIDGTMTYMNPAAREAKRRPVGRTIRRHDDEYHPHHAITCQIIADDRQVITSKTAAIFEEECETSNGRRVYLVQKSPEFADDGSVRGIVGIAHDITERKREEQALRAENERRGHFEAELSHELRGPLSGLSLGISVLEAKMPRDTSLVKTVSGLRKQTELLTRLANDLLDANRIGAGKLLLDETMVDLRAVLTTAIDQVSAAAEQGGVAIWADLESTADVTGDESRLTQVFFNLLSNAVKFSARGATVHVSVVRDETKVMAVVRDEGRGFSPAEEKRIFDMFYQSRRDEDIRLGGLGIGLALTKRFVELHRGTVKINSPGVGLGCEARVELPLSSKSHSLLN